MRPAEAIEDSVQNDMAMAMPAPSNCADHVEVVLQRVVDRVALRRSSRCCRSPNRSAPRGRASSGPGRWVSSASRKTKPTTAETATDRKMPHALATRAPTVSSATWADASYPVYVQLACSRREHEGQEERIGDGRSVAQIDRYAERCEVVGPRARRVLRLDGEERQAGHVRLAGHEDEHDDGRHDGDVPPDADLVEDGHDIDATMLRTRQMSISTPIVSVAPVRIGTSHWPG